jgi:hypothetical protein
MNNIPLLSAVLATLSTPAPVLADGPNPFDPRTGEQETRKEKKEKDKDENYEDEEDEEDE